MKPLPPRRAQGYVKWVVVAAVVMASALGAYLVLGALRPTVTVSEATMAKAEQAFYATGTIQPHREFYTIRAAAAGYLQRPEGIKHYVDKGEDVTLGQVLVRVFSEAQLRELAKADAELKEKQGRAADDGPVLTEFDALIAACRKSILYANNELDRIREMRAKNNASITDVERAADRLQILEGDLASLASKRGAAKLSLARELEVAQRQRDIAQWNFDQQFQKSPVTGKVLDRPVSEGTYVAINDPILQVADVSPENLVMRASVDEEDIDKVKEDQPVTMVLYSFPNEKEPLSGKVIQIYPKADPERRTFEVDVKLEVKDKRLRPGMTGELAFQTAFKEKTLVVPSQAVQEGKLYVVRDGRVKRIDAKVGIKGIEKVEVLEGLQPGDRVVISPAGELKDGQAVRTNYVDPLTAGKANRPAESAPGKFGF